MSQFVTWRWEIDAHIHIRGLQYGVLAKATMPDMLRTTVIHS